MKIGIDISGGDFAPKATIGGSILARKELSSDVHLCLIGDQQIIHSSLIEAGSDPAQFEIIHAPEVIGMGEHPSKVFSQKPNSSIAVGFDMLKNKKIDAFASAGNSGAILVGSIMFIGLVAGIIRPCISTVLPKENGGVGILLDSGINPDCKADLMYQFGLVGSLYAQYVFSIPNPKVGLLNIGHEAEKGSLLAQAAHNLMKDTTDFNFIGNVESRDLYKDNVDVVVCDGFTGNIILKQTEAMYRLFVKQGFRNDFIERYNYENYGGTPLLGANATVVMGHGISNEKAIKNMILHAKDVQLAQLNKKINSAMEIYTQQKS
jgi:phosphate acyltransferase